MNFFVFGSDVVVDEYFNILRENEDLSNRSKYPIGTKVRVAYDVAGIINILVSGYTFNKTKARQIAFDLAGTIVEVIGVSRLADDEGKLGTYYTIETNEGLMYLLPEHLLEEKFFSISEHIY